MTHKKFINLINDSYFENLNNAPMLTGKGVVLYDPERKGLKSNATCCIVEVDPQIAEYYRHQINEYYKLNLIKPSWKPHISIIQGSIPRNGELYNTFWKKYEGLNVDFQYSIFPRFSGDKPSAHLTELAEFWFLNVNVPIFHQLRSDFKLRNDFNPHLTIAKK
jgi:hypothetical protein